MDRSRRDIDKNNGVGNQERFPRGRGLSMTLNLPIGDKSTQWWIRAATTVILCYLIQAKASTGRGLAAGYASRGWKGE